MRIRARLRKYPPCRDARHRRDASVSVGEGTPRAATRLGPVGAVAIALAGLSALGADLPRRPPDDPAVVSPQHADGEQAAETVPSDTEPEVLGRDGPVPGDTVLQLAPTTEGPPLDPAEPWIQDIAAETGVTPEQVIDQINRQGEAEVAAEMAAEAAGPDWAGGSIDYATGKTIFRVTSQTALEKVQALGLPRHVVVELAGFSALDLERIRDEATRLVVERITAELESLPEVARDDYLRDSGLSGTGYVSSLGKDRIELTVPDGSPIPRYLYRVTHGPDGSPRADLPFDAFRIVVRAQGADLFSDGASPQRVGDLVCHYDGADCVWGGPAAQPLSFLDICAAGSIANIAPTELRWLAIPGRCIDSWRFSRYGRATAVGTEATSMAEVQAVGFGTTTALISIDDDGKTVRICMSPMTLESDPPQCGGTGDSENAPIRGDVAERLASELGSMGGYAQVTIKQRSEGWELLDFRVVEKFVPVSQRGQNRAER